MFFFTEDIFNAWIGFYEVDHVVVARALLLASFLRIVFVSVNSNLLIMIGRHKTLGIISLAEAVANFVLSLVLFKVFGVLGVALGTLIGSTFISTIFVYLELAKTINIKPRELFSMLHYENLILFMICSATSFIIKHLTLGMNPEVVLLTMTLINSLIMLTIGFNYILPKPYRKKIKLKLHSIFLKI